MLIALIALAILAGALCFRLHALEAEIAALETDAAYGIASRPGLDRHWQRRQSQSQGHEVVFMDLDGLHALNERLGYGEVDRRIRTALALREGDTYFIARWYSGDEIVLLVPKGDAAGAAARIQTRLQGVGLSATYGTAPAQTDLRSAVAEAAEKVQAAKAAGRRGTLNGQSLLMPRPNVATALMVEAAHV